MSYAILVAAGIGIGIAIAILAAAIHRPRAVGQSDESSAADRRCEASFALTAVGCAHLDPNGRWLAANDALCEMTGYCRDELMRKSAEDLAHPDDEPPDRTEMAALFSGAVDKVSF